MAQSPYISNITSDDFSDAVLNASFQQPVLVDFWADWCSPCRMLMPVLAKLVDEYAGRFLLAKVNTDEERALAAQLGIRSLPTVRLFHQGEMVGEFMGALPESAVRSFLEDHLPKTADDGLQLGQDLLHRDPQQAMEIAAQLLQQDPGHIQALYLRVNAALALGQLDAAQTTLDSLPDKDKLGAEGLSLSHRLHFARLASDTPEYPVLLSAAQNQTAPPTQLRQLAAHQVIRGQYAEALELLYRLFSQHRTLDDGVC